MKSGDRVTWHYTTGGGFGYVLPIAGVIRSVTPKRAVIEVALLVRGQWVRETRTVAKHKLTPRTRLVPELGEATNGNPEVAA